MALTAATVAKRIAYGVRCWHDVAEVRGPLPSSHPGYVALRVSRLDGSSYTIHVGRDTE